MKQRQRDVINQTIGFMWALNAYPECKPFSYEILAQCEDLERLIQEADEEENKDGK